MMQPLPQEFLEQVATEKYLTTEQREAFVALYEDANRAPESIAGNLHISDNAFRTRLSGVYKAFGIDGKGSNKKRRLHQELLEMYRQRQGRDSDDPILDRGVDDFVERIRRQVAADIKQRCGTMRVLDMAQPVGLGEIYTDMNILEKVSRSRRQDLSQMHELVGLDLEDFKRFSFGEIAIERVAGLEVVKEHRKLMIWGKPGAGKTTFLKHLAMSCIEGQLFPELVPFFVTLKSFAEEDGQPNLFTYLHNQAVTQGVDAERLKEIVVKGRAMIFLDGLDEVRQEDSQRVIKGIQEFADIWRENFFAITCRIAAKEYTFQGGFTEVEVADFDEEQIACFVNNWFRCKQQETKAVEFINALKEQEPIQELASSPLLLTLLCLVFEENFNFPQSRAELYKEGLDILLKKWDGKRAIQRDEIYKNLTVKRREQMLSEIAFKTFEKGEYFFKKNRVENLITEFIQNLPDAKDDPETLRLDSEVVLKAIEAQHGILVERAKGIYSFSHLTFQEYLTAKYLSTKVEKHVLIRKNLNDIRWREVILLVCEEITDIDISSHLLLSIKSSLDYNNSSILQSLLEWLSKKEKSNSFAYNKYDFSSISKALHIPFKGEVHSSLVRSIYLYLESSLYFNLEAEQFSINLEGDLLLDFLFYKSLKLSFLDRFISSINDLSHLYFEIKSNMYDLVQEFTEEKTDYYYQIDELLNELVDIQDLFILDDESDKDIVEEEVTRSGEISYWGEKLRWVMVENRDIAHGWLWKFCRDKYDDWDDEFEYFGYPLDEKEEWIEKLKLYWYGNCFLLTCLSSAYVHRDVREWIENTMFLPMSELEKMPPPEL